MSRSSEHQTPNTILIGLSGPSSSGKTTLARLLRSIFTVFKLSSVTISLSIIHLDDFYKTDANIPVKTFSSSSEHGTRELQDWDCVESLDLDLLDKTLRHVSSTGSLPDDMISKEDQNSVGDSGVPESQVQNLHVDMQQWLKTRVSSNRNIKIWIIDGFLLYPDPLLSSSSSTHSADHSSRTEGEIQLLARLHSLLQPLLNLKLFLPCSRQQTVSRRTARSGYVTLEGFWTDPPGYVEDVVWPNYVRDHRWMFRQVGTKDRGENDDQMKEIHDPDETKVDVERVRSAGIQVAPGQGNLEMKELLLWAVNRIKDTLVEQI